MQLGLGLLLLHVWVYWATQGDVLDLPGRFHDELDSRNDEGDDVLAAGGVGCWWSERYEGK